MKSALTPEQIAELAVEADRLRQAGHPGVIQLVEHRVTADRAELRTEFAGEPLSRWRGTVARAVGIVAAVAATVADLHDLGLVHGRIDQTHVLLGAESRPRLCGLSTPPAGTTPADDVLALGRLLEELGDRALRTDRRGAGSFLWPRARVADQRALRQLVVQATDPIPPRRPTARTFARSVLAAFTHADLAPPPTREAPSAPPHPLAPPAFAPEPDLDGDPTFEAQVTEVFGDQSTAELDEVFADRPWRSTTGSVMAIDRPVPPTRRPIRVVGIVGTLGLAGVAASALALRASPPRDADAPEPAAVPSPTAAELCASDDPGSADVNGDGCPEAVHVMGSVVEIGGEQWTVGDPGDAVAIGDWDCDGRATPAAYRPSTGDVFVFSTWAAADDPIAVESVAQVDGGAGISAVAGPKCDTPAVDLVDGGQRFVEVTR